MSGTVGQITPKELTAALTGTDSISKVYDGNTMVTTALSQGANYQFTGMVDGDTLGLTGTGTYDNKNVADDKPVSFTGLSLTGTDKGNYKLTNTSLSGNVGQITQKDITAALIGTNSVTKVYDGNTKVTMAPQQGMNYQFIGTVAGDAVDLTGTGIYTDDKNVGDNKSVAYQQLSLTGADAGNYHLTTEVLHGNIGQITTKSLTATLNGDNAFTKVYDGTTAVSLGLTLGTNYSLSGVIDSDTVSLTANSSGAYNDKNAGDNKTISYSGVTLTGADAGNYSIADTLTGAVGQITRKTLTGALASGYSFDKVYDGTLTAYLGNRYTLNGVVAGDNVLLTAAKGFYDSSAAGDRTVTFSGFSINDGNYLLSMADSLTGTGKITSSGQDRNYRDALTSISSFFGANPSGGYTIFSGSPEDYIARAVSQNNGQSYQVGVGQVTQTWYNGPLTVTIVNGGITLPKDILLGSTYDSRTVIVSTDGTNQQQISEIGR
jgi:hypothetical protein